MPIDLDAANIFFQLIAKRYEKNNTIITTNMPFSKWGEFFGSATLANAVLIVFLMIKIKKQAVKDLYYKMKQLNNRIILLLILNSFCI